MGPLLLNALLPEFLPQTLGDAISPLPQPLLWAQRVQETSPHAWGGCDVLGTRTSLMVGLSPGLTVPPRHTPPPPVPARSRPSHVSLSADRGSLPAPPANWTPGGRANLVENVSQLNDIYGRLGT